MDRDEFRVHADHVAGVNRRTTSAKLRLLVANDNVLEPSVKLLTAHSCNGTQSPAVRGLCLVAGWHTTAKGVCLPLLYRRSPRP